MEVKNRTKTIAEIKKEIRNFSFIVDSSLSNEMKNKEVDINLDIIIETSIRSVYNFKLNVLESYRLALKWLLSQIRGYTIIMEFVDVPEICNILTTALNLYKSHYLKGNFISIQEVNNKDLQSLLSTCTTEFERIFSEHLVEVFVYGSLKSKESRHYLIEFSEFTGIDSIENACLFDLGEYPMLVLQGNDEVFGECYRIPLKTLQLLDKVEGHPHYYQRCWCYSKSKRKVIIYKGSQALVLNAPRIPSGRWDSLHKQGKSTYAYQDGEFSLTEIISVERYIDELPLSLIQQYLLYRNRSGRSSSLDSVVGVFKILGFINLSVLDQSLKEVIRRHTNLQVRFHAVNGSLVQSLSLNHNLGLTTIDIQAYLEKDKESYIKDIINEHFNQGLNIEGTDLLAIKLITLGKDEHILLLTMHRIIADEQSLNVFVQEVISYYDILVTESTLSLPEITYQYTDFAQQQLQNLQTDTLKQQLKYWKHQLNGDLAALDIPTFQPKVLLVDSKDKPYSNQDRNNFKISEQIVTSLKILAEKEEKGLFTILLTVLKVLLYRYTQSTDIIVVCPITNRICTETQELIGPLANNLIIRTQFKEDLSFRELLLSVDQVVTEASNNKDIPYDYVLDSLHLKHSSYDHSSPLQVRFTLKNEIELISRFKTLTVNTLETKIFDECFILNLSVEEVGQELIASWKYSTSLFDADTIERMTGHFQALLGGIIVNPEQSISTLPLLTSQELNKLLVDWVPEQPEYPQDICLHTLVEAQVDRYPEAIAVRFEEEQLSYIELNQRANQLSHYLQALGVVPETPVALCMEMSLDLAIAILALFKAGGTYVPIEPTYPTDRIGFILEDAHISVLLTQEKFLDKFPKIEMQVICLDSIWGLISQNSKENPINGVTGKNIAYILYTSGSTGQPKGVQLSHSVCCSRESWEQKTFKLTESDRVLMKSSWSTREFFWPLIVGAQIIMARSGGYKDSQYLAELIYKERVTVISLVPSVIKLLLEEPNINSCTYLRHVISTGEAISSDIQTEFFSRLSAQLHNVYGLNEANYSAHWVCKAEHHQQGIVPIGYATDMQIYLLDPHLQLVPIGVPGEIHITGFGLAQGYLNRPDLNAERFIPNLLNDKTNSKLFKTGDLARYLPDGVIQYLGRIDYQVNIRGLRVELGEIEFVLRQHSAIREAIILEREDTPGNKILVAYVVLNKDSHILTDELRNYLKQKLPDYMIPAVFMYLDALPMTPNGKVARLKLPAPSRKNLKLNKPFIAPRNDVDKQIAEIWSIVLKIEQISIHDNFFELGGYSLLATRVISRLHKIFKVELSLQDFTERPTISELSNFLETRLNQQ